MVELRWFLLSFHWLLFLESTWKTKQTTQSKENMS